MAVAAALVPLRGERVMTSLLFFYEEHDKIATEVYSQLPPPSPNIQSTSVDETWPMQLCKSSISPSNMSLMVISKLFHSFIVHDQSNFRI